MDMSRYIFPLSEHQCKDYRAFGRELLDLSDKMGKIADVYEIKLSRVIWKSGYEKSMLKVWQARGKGVKEENREYKQTGKGIKEENKGFKPTGKGL